MVAEWSKALSQIQVEIMPLVPGSNPHLVNTYLGMRTYLYNSRLICSDNLACLISGNHACIKAGSEPLIQEADPHISKLAKKARM